MAAAVTMHALTTPIDPSDLYARVARGWNTWNTASMTSHVLLPHAFALNLGVKEHTKGFWLREVLIGRWGRGNEEVRPGAHAYDGRFTDLEVAWMGWRMRVRTAHADEHDWVAWVEPLAVPRRAPLLTVEAGFLWGRPGRVWREETCLAAESGAWSTTVHATKPGVADDPVPTLAAVLTLPLNGPIGLSTGRSRDAAEIQAAIRTAELAEAGRHARCGELAEASSAMHACLAWNTIFDPINRRPISPVSRMFSAAWGGWILYPWDTFFAALMMAGDARELAYANVLAVLGAAQTFGFVPNFVAANGAVSRDRSHPMLGSPVVLALYRRFGDVGFVAAAFEDLLTWNRWWRRRADAGRICPGSDASEPVVGNEWETPARGVGGRFGAALETGSDNSPIYDDAVYDGERHRLREADVGLTALYATDCAALAELADALGRASEAAELRERAAEFRAGLDSLWNEATGIFQNRDVTTDAFNPRIVPMLCWPMLAGAASAVQVERMIKDQWRNPSVFAGEWLLPSVARNDPAYPEQNYVRGRVWPHMNFLVWWGLRAVGRGAEARELADKSVALLLRHWRESRRVYETYRADTGESGDRGNCDPFYHWGGLLAFMALVEAGHEPAPALPLV